MEQPSHCANPKLGPRIWQVSRILIVAYLAAGIGCAALQRRMIYHPRIIASDDSDRLAASVGLERWRDFTGQNIGWKRLSQMPQVQGIVLITHGNAGCAIDRSDYAKAMQESAAMDVFILEYPGFGDRAGSPSERNLFKAADEGFAALPTNGPVYLVGESLGTGVAAYLAGSHPTNVAGVLLVAPYRILTEVAQYHVRIFPVRWLLQDRFQSEDYLRPYRGPIAMLLAGKDRVVPAKFGRRLFDSYAGPKRLWEFPDANHETIHQQPPEFWNAVAKFWQTNEALPNSR